MSMLELFRDGVWQAIGALLTVVVSFVIYLMQRRRSEVAFGPLSSKNILTVAEDAIARIVVLFDGASVSNVHMLHIGFKNSGNRSIRATDYERPIKILFASDSKIISSTMVDYHPQSLSPAYSSDEQVITVAPMLMNPGDYWVMKVLLSGTNTDFQSDIRIADVSTVYALQYNRDVSMDNELHKRFGRGVLKIVVATFLLSLIFYLLDHFFSDGYISFYFFSFLAAIILLISLWARFTGRLNRRIDDICE